MDLTTINQTIRVAEVELEVKRVITSKHTVAHKQANVQLRVDEAQDVVKACQKRLKAPGLTGPISVSHARGHS